VCGKARESRESYISFRLCINNRRVSFGSAKFIHNRVAMGTSQLLMCVGKTTHAPRGKQTACVALDLYIYIYIYIYIFTVVTVFDRPTNRSQTDYDITNCTGGVTRNSGLEGPIMGIIFRCVSHPLKRRHGCVIPMQFTFKFPFAISDIRF